MRSPILVTGAAGRVGATGRTLAEMLLKQGKAVRAMVRKEDEVLVQTLRRRTIGYLKSPPSRQAANIAAQMAGAVLGLPGNVPVLN
jgi:nucleoside-diphosphate-sugar epimerase